jgi:hypothetical protein
MYVEGPDGTIPCGARCREFGFDWHQRIDGKGVRSRGHIGGFLRFGVVGSVDRCLVAWDLALELGLTPYVVLYKSPEQLRAEKAERSRRWREKHGRERPAPTSTWSEWLPPPSDPGGAGDAP